MEMSAACSPPIQPTSTAAEQAHPRYGEYCRYRAAMSRQLVSGCSFAVWLLNTEQHENGFEVTFSVEAGHSLAPGWYKHKFAPRTRRMTRFGPVATKAEAEAL